MSQILGFLDGSFRKAHDESEAKIRKISNEMGRVSLIWKTGIPTGFDFTKFSNIKEAFIATLDNNSFNNLISVWNSKTQYLKSLCSKKGIMYSHWEIRWVRKFNLGTLESIKSFDDIASKVFANPTDEVLDMLRIIIDRGNLYKAKLKKMLVHFCGSSPNLYSHMKDKLICELTNRASQVERRNIEHENMLREDQPIGVDMCGILVPEELIFEILSYIGSNTKWVLDHIGVISEEFYLFALMSIKTVFVNHTNIRKIPLIVLRNAMAIYFSPYMIHKEDVEYFHNNSNSAHKIRIMNSRCGASDIVLYGSKLEKNFFKYLPGVKPNLGRLYVYNVCGLVIDKSYFPNLHSFGFDKFHKPGASKNHEFMGVSKEDYNKVRKIPKVTMKFLKHVKKITFAKFYLRTYLFLKGRWEIAGHLPDFVGKLKRVRKLALTLIRHPIHPEYSNYGFCASERVGMSIWWKVARKMKSLHTLRLYLQFRKVTAGGLPRLNKFFVGDWPQIMELQIVMHVERKFNLPEVMKVISYLNPEDLDNWPKQVTIQFKVCYGNIPPSSILKLRMENMPRKWVKRKSISWLDILNEVNDENPKFAMTGVRKRSRLFGGGISTGSTRVFHAIPNEQNFRSDIYVFDRVV